VSRGEPAGPLHEFCLADAVSGGVNAPLDDHNPRWPRSLQHRGPHRAGHVRGVSIWSRCCVPFISSQHPRRGDDLTRSRPTTTPANLRDVRGLRTDHGGIVRRAVPYRSEVPLVGPARGTDVAIWPPATVIDLRSPAEPLGPHPLAGVAAVHQVPLGTSLAPALAAAQTDDPDLTFAYRHLTRDAAAEIAGIIGLVATAPGPILVHCTAARTHRHRRRRAAARDRGRRDDILADYLRTEPNMPRLWAVLRAAGVPEPHHRALLGVQRPALDAVLDEIDSVPGGAAGWVTGHGTDPDPLERLRRRLLSPVLTPPTAG
jgi:protein-tyrosine phosphatase